MTPVRHSPRSAVEHAVEHQDRGRAARRKSTRVTDVTWRTHRGSWTEGSKACYLFHWLRCVRAASVDQGARRHAAIHETLPPLRRSAACGRRGHSCSGSVTCAIPFQPLPSRSGPPAAVSRLHPDSTVLNPRVAPMGGPPFPHACDRQRRLALRSGAVRGAPAPRSAPSAAHRCRRRCTSRRDVAIRTGKVVPRGQERT